MTRFLVVPQWQGSSSSRAMQLIDGAAAIAGDLPRTASVTVDVPVEAGESLDSGVHRLSALQRVARMHLTALAEILGEHVDGAHDEIVLTVGGDGGVATTAALAATGATRGELDPGAVVVWFSAHADLHDTTTSPTGAFDTMAVRALLDDAVPRPAEHGLAASQLLLAGVRAIEPAEAEVAQRLGIGILTTDDLTPASLVAAVRERGATSVFIHVDVDVLDPGAMTGLASPEPFGLDAAALIACIGAVRAEVPLRAAAITEFSPASPAAAVEDLGTILRLVGALA
ncbi:arginase family protein [Microbacterium terrisoli]|uniref:arginase family protein n=1 Tax=Microbacterium terrisoli TaxID=3242192 RepID=UPI002804185D|nr:arginase family protein [Microbacterium protaetiae]